MLKRLQLFVLLINGVLYAQNSVVTIQKHQPAIANILPIDKKATKETVNLYNNLKKLLDKGIMFGHQDALAYGPARSS